MSSAAFNLRLERVRALIQSSAVESIVLRKNPNLAWLIGGRVHVPFTLDAACFDLVITKDSITAITNAIEAPRLIAEEFDPSITVEIINWWESRDRLLPSGDQVGTDTAGGNRVDLSQAVEELRQSLNEFDVARLEAVAKDSAIALGAALGEIPGGATEIEVAGLISKKLWESDLDLTFIGVAGDSRVKQFRHPLPTSAPIGKKVVASICARRKGLIASVTRIATFGAPEGMADYFDLLNVEAALLDATKVGTLFSVPINSAIAAYSANRFDSDEWTRHHQGGPTGYLPRDWPATANSNRVIAENQPIAWNPTGKGWKAEDTILATSAGVKILSLDPSWPVIEVAGRLRPGVLEL